MSTALATTARAPTTPSLPPWAERSVAAMTTGVFPPTIPACHALTAPQRREATAILADLSASLAPGSRRDIGAAVAVLLANYPAPDASPAIQAARAQSWAEALEGLPAWAVDAARRKWMRGEVEGVNPDFAPKPPRFRQIVVELLTPVHEKRSRLAMLMRAVPEPDISAEERARVAARFPELQAELAKLGSGPARASLDTIPDREMRAAAE